MFKISEYEIQTQIYESANSRVYRGFREQDYLPVVLKILKKDYPTPEEITRYKLEYEITQSLSLSGVIQAYQLQPYQNSLVMILEDFGGESLEKVKTTRSLTLQEFLTLAIQISESLGQIHAAGVIHKDINPSNIVFNGATQQLKIIDFGIATVLSRETLPLKSPTVLEGTLAYMSPEQTGRMNRSLDYRTDFYSLGVTFYQLLTGHLPFETMNPLELVHYHIALEPPVPHRVCPEIPPVLSAIVLKLLAKTAEERYQSAWGLKADLEKCLSQLQHTGQIESFILAQQDGSDRFQIPEKLYGRDAEVKTLLRVFQTIVQSVHTRNFSDANFSDPNFSNSNFSPNVESPVPSPAGLVLVAGYSGIGKSALVQEIYRPITQQQGYFISGKFDQYQRNIPYFAIAQAFQGLIKQLLTENEVRLQQWRDKLLTALGTNCRVISQVIPNLELIVGTQPEIPALPPTEAQNRFNQVFQDFIQVFTQPEHPLVLFLDDLQWVDNASLKLLQRLATAAGSHALMLIGAYRDNEVSATHPLIQMVNEVQQAGGQIHLLHLSALRLTDINHLIAETLHCTPADALPLAKLVQAKTGGNPFFMNEFLKSLYTESLLNFNASTGWNWSIEQIQAREITDNVVELMAQKIQKLQPQTQTLLQLAACIGNQFDLEMLAFATELTLRQAAKVLRMAIVEGFILPLSSAHKSVELDVPLPGNRSAIEYKFVHDRIQQAAYSLIPESDRKVIHWQIGQRLLQKARLQDPEQQDQEIFDITNQLNLGRDCIQQDAERETLIQLNVAAGEKARASAAYNSALRYFQTGLALLTEHCWQTEYDLTLNLYIKTAEAEYLNINFEEAIALLDTALENTVDLLDRVQIYELQMQICMAQLELAKAIEIGLWALERLGITLLTLEGEADLIIPLPDLDNLSTLTVMTDPYKLAAMQILKILCTPVFMAKPEIFPQIILTMVNLCIEHGNSALSAFGYGFYGLLLSGTGKVNEGYHAGKIALQLLETFNARALTAKVYNLFNSNIRSWKEHARNSIAPLREAVQVGLETGDIEWGGYAAANLCSYLFFCEENLATAMEQQAIYSDLCIKIQQETPTYFIQVWTQLGANLCGLVQDKYLLIGKSFDEAHMLPRLIAARSGTVLYIFYVAKTILLYHFGEYEQALQQVELAQQQAGAAFGFMQVAVLNFYHSLALLGRHATADSNFIADLKQIEANQIQLKFWADHAPMNYQHKFDLVAAEVARVWGQTEAAADRFDRAIQAAKHYGYLQEEALANELAAKFYLAREKTTIAKAYLQEARYGYLKWGATAKVQDLEQQYAQLLKSQTERSGTLEITLSQSASSKLEVLDLASVLKASQAIASEIVLDQLLTHLMTILIENAGAQKGYLILPTEGEWRVEAIGSIHTEQVAVLQALTLSSIEASPDPILPIPMIYYVIRTQESVVLNHAAQEGGFETDPWIIKQQSKSILCAPLLNRGRLSGVVFLENSLTISAFTPERIEVLRLLSTQAAISIDNARLLKQQAELNQALRTEIAEREKAERDRDRLITILEASTDHIGMADPEGKTLWINAQVRKLMGISLQDNIAELKISDYHPAWAFEIIHQQGIPTAIAHGSWMGETALLERNGNEIPVSQLLIAHKTPEGQLEYLSTIMRDISALKSAEAQVRQLNTELEERVVQRTEQLEAANKELEAFSYSVSHDLRAPLRAIDGFSRMIQEDYSEQLDSEANRYLKIVRENAKRMGELIDDLLTLSRLNRKELYKQPIFPNDLIEGVLQDLTLDMEGRQIEFTIAELPICQADLSLLKQVWVNILSNAIKYTQYKPIAQIEVGYVIIQHENIQHENIQHEDIQHENIQHEDMKHGIANEGAYFIRDNGAGFDMQYADNLFGVFQRLHREQDFKGTGVGLATVQRIIHRHGGRIWAEAAIDQGATFYFTLPDEAV